MLFLNGIQSFQNQPYISQLQKSVVPATQWVRCLMQNMAQWSGDDWHKDLKFIEDLPEAEMFLDNIPSYFSVPLHGFRNGGICKFQAIYQSVSMRHIMRTFQRNSNYREDSISKNVQKIICDLKYTPELILDMGCGSGDSTLAIANASPDSLVIGVDLSPMMIELAKLKTQKKEFLLADAGDVKLVGESVDMIVSFAMFHEMPLLHSKKVIEEMARILKPKGTILIWDQRMTPFSSFQILSDPMSDPIEPFLASYSKLKIVEEFKKLHIKVDTFQEGMFQLWICQKIDPLL